MIHGNNFNILCSSCLKDFPRWETTLLRNMDYLKGLLNGWMSNLIYCSIGTYHEYHGISYRINRYLMTHYNGVIMSAIVFQITSLTIFYSIVIQTKIKVNIKDPRHWSLCGAFTGDRGIPRTNGQLRENFSIWWRHHGHDIDRLAALLVRSMVVSSMRNFCYLERIAQQTVQLPVIGLQCNVPEIPAGTSAQLLD